LPARRRSTLLLLVAALATLAALLAGAAVAASDSATAYGAGQFGTISGTAPIAGMNVVLTWDRPRRSSSRRSAHPKP
jgi:hypothetical protein